MADEPERSSHIRDWIQTLLVVTGIVAGIWQFVLKEYWIPAGAPINLTTDVNVAEAGFKGQGKETSDKQLEAIELKVAARNPSTRDLWLLSSCWYAYGVKIAADNGNKNWTNRITEQIKEHGRTREGSHYRWKDFVVVAAGEVFTEDQILHPNESIANSIMFYVPQNLYDVVYVHIELPTTPVADSAQVEWTVTPDKGCDSHVYRMKTNGERGEEVTDFLKAFKDRTLQFQSATSTRELSLWQSKSPATAATQPTGTAAQR